MSRPIFDDDRDLFDDESDDKSETAASAGKFSSRNARGGASSGTARSASLNESRARQELFITAISAIIYLSGVAAILLAVSDSWVHFSSFARFLTIGIALGAAYAIAFVTRRNGHNSTSRIFFIVGSIFFGFSFILLGTDSPLQLTDADSFAQTVNAAFDDPDEGGIEAEYGVGDDSAQEFAPEPVLSIDPRFPAFWATGAFLVALALPSTTLHFVAVAAMLLWQSECATSRVITALLVMCALGEVWASRRKSRVVALLYAAMTLCSLIAALVTLDPTKISLFEVLFVKSPIVLVLLSASIYCYGDTFKNVVSRGLGLGLGGISLAAITFPNFWIRFFSEPTLNSDGAVVLAPIVSSSLTNFLAIASCALFIMFCANMITTGATRSRARFIYGCALFGIWLVSFTAIASREYGMRRAAGALVLCACFLGAILMFERTFEGRYERKDESDAESGKGVSRAGVSTDGAEDDPEFDDPFDGEARAKSGARSAFEAYRRGLFNAALNYCAVPFLYCAVAYQFLTLFLAR